MILNEIYEPALIMGKYKENTKKMFFLWEYLASEGLQDSARDYLLEHENDDIPFEMI